MQGQIGKEPKWSDFNTTLGGTTAPFAVHDWYTYNRKLFIRRSGPITFTGDITTKECMSVSDCKSYCMNDTTKAAPYVCHGGLGVLCSTDEDCQFHCMKDLPNTPPYVCHKTNKGTELESDLEFVPPSAKFVHMTTATYPCSDCCDGGDGVNDSVNMT